MADVNSAAGEVRASERVRKLAQAYWESESTFLNHGPGWNAEHWTRVLNLPELENFVWKPEWKKISRELILGQWESANDEESALEAFFLTMAWGFGSNFRGPWKTVAMFESMREKNFGAYLLEVKGVVAKSPEEAFRLLLTQRVKQLGPVYASKLLYAMSPASHRSPVMDMWIERWGKQLFGLDFIVSSTRSVGSNVDALSRFSDFCDSALIGVKNSQSAPRDESENDIGFIEYLIFWDAKYTLRRRWQGVAGFPAWVQNENLA